MKMNDYLPAVEWERWAGPPDGSLRCSLYDPGWGQVAKGFCVIDGDGSAEMVAFYWDRTPQPDQRGLVLTTATGEVYTVAVLRVDVVDAGGLRTERYRLRVEDIARPKPRLVARLRAILAHR